MEYKCCALLTTALILVMLVNCDALIRCAKRSEFERECASRHVLKGAFVLGENDFRKSFSLKPACLAATKNEIFRKFTSCWPKFTPLTRKWIYILIFTSIHFRKEREREREREKREPRSGREREEEETSPAITPLVDRRAARSTSSAIVQQARSSITPLVDRAAFRTIAPISPLISPSQRDLIFSSASRSQFDRIWWIFLLGFVSFVNECGIDSLFACLQLRKCMENWACKAFSVKMFEWTKHRN